MKIKLAIFAVFVFILLLFFSSLTEWESFSVGLFVFFFLEFLQELGNKIVIFNITVLMAIVGWLIMPAIFYHIYTKDDYLAKLWLRYMWNPSDEYFSFVVPGTLMMILGFRIPLLKQKYKSNPVAYVDAVKKYLEDKPKVGLILIAVGVVSGILDFLAPENLRQVLYLFSHLTYVGVFYVIYSPSKMKRSISLMVFLLAFGQAVAGGMFGEFIYMTSLTLILILLGKNISFNKKLLISLLGIFIIVIIQSVKAQYREKTWTQGAGADPLYFGELVADRLSQPEFLLDKDKLFFVSVRMNQGWLISVTMFNVPERYSFANGETIWKSVAAAFVPRFLWPDKPEAGGKDNLKRFWGFEIKTYSMNIGPIGEAYANFGRIGGIIYMFFYGAFFNLMLSIILRLAKRKPSLILWLPFLFFYAISVETDLLITMSSLVKASIFTVGIFWGFRSLFRIHL